MTKRPCWPEPGTWAERWRSIRASSATGLQIVALFDSDASRLGELPNGRMVFPIEKMPNLVRRLQVQIGILAVPEEAAQSVADAMVSAGIKAIWNFAPCRLSVPADVFVKNEDLASELATLSYHVAQRKIACSDRQAGPDGCDPAAVDQRAAGDGRAVTDSSLGHRERLSLLTITVCVGSSCYVRGSEKLAEMLQQMVEREGLSARIEFTGAFCMEQCSMGVSVRVGNRVYRSVQVENVASFFADEVMPRLRAPVQTAAAATEGAR